MVGSDGVETAKEDMNDSLLQFRRWLEVNGVQLRGCTLKPCEEDSEAGLGVYTTDGYLENGILIVTPLVLAITPMTALQDPLLGPVFAKLFEDGDVDDRLVVMLYLLVENLRGDSSFWAPYLKMLPRKFGMTLCYTEEELLELKGTSLYRATKIQQNGLRQHFHEKVKGLAETILKCVGWAERRVEFDDFLWANCIFWTRALNIPFPQSLVTPQSPMPAFWPEEAMPGAVVDGTPVVERSGLESANADTVEKKEQGSVAVSFCTEQHGEGDLRRDDKLEGGALQEKLSAENAVKPRVMDDHFDMGNADQTLSELGTNGKLDPEANVWVEGLVPGIDFCNHASQAIAVWEVDDQAGTASGVRHSMYLVTGQGVELPSNTEVLINYGNKGNEELLYLYGFVVEKNPDDYLMVHFPKEALELGVCVEEKSLLLEEQKLPLRWLLSSSLLKTGCVNQRNCEASPKSNALKEELYSHNYSWSGRRKPPHILEKPVFPEELVAALRIIAMTQEEVQSATALLEEGKVVSVNLPGEAEDETNKQTSGPPQTFAGAAGASISFEHKLNLSEPGDGRVPSAEDIRAAVWEVCGNAGALQLLQDLLISKMIDIDDGTGPEEKDADLLEKDANARIEVVKKRQLGSTYVGDEEFLQTNLMSRNKRACVVYRKGQKQLVKLFLQEAEYALQLWIS